MNINFLYHILISSCIFYLLTAGAKLYVSLRGSMDFSYVAIIIFGAYAGALLNIVRGWNMLAAIGGAFALSLFFTFFVLYLSSKLEGLYFTIGTLTFYILMYQLASNLESVTGGVFGLSGMTRLVGGEMFLDSLAAFLVGSLIVCALTMGFLIYFKKTYMYQVLKGWAEREIVVKSLGVAVNRYKFIMILLTTFLAVLGGNLYSFYYLFIDPHSFWLPLLILLLVLVYGSYKFNELGTFVFTCMIISLYEYLRFFKIVEPAQIGYFREIIFAGGILVVSFWVFRTTTFGRET